MSSGVVAQIRTPTEDELKRMRELWGALKQKPLPSTETGIELKTYLAHAARMVGTIAGLHPVTGKIDQHLHIEDSVPEGTKL